MVLHVLTVRRTDCRYGDLEIDLGKPFRRATMYDLVREATGCDFWELRGDAAAFREAAEAAAPGVTSRHGGGGDGAFAPGRVVNDLFEDLVEGTLRQVRPRCPAAALHGARAHACGTGCSAPWWWRCGVSHGVRACTG